MQKNGSPKQAENVGRSNTSAKQPERAASQSAPKRSAKSRGNSAAPRSEPRKGSTMWACIEVLRGRRNAMSPAAIYAEIKQRNLAPGLKGKTPEQTVAAALAVSAKKGRYVQRTEPGKFLLRKAN